MTILYLEDDLRRRATQQAELADLGQRALAGLPLPALMDDIARGLTRVLQAEYCEVLELLPERQALRLVAGAGWPPGEVGAATVPAGEKSMAGYTLLSEEPVVVDDLPRETRFSPPALLAERGIASGITSIIHGDDAPWGVLGVFTAQPRHFHADDAHFLQSVANVLADAIVRGRAEDALRVAHEQTMAILGGVGEGVTVQTPDGRLVYANEAAARLMHVASAQAVMQASPRGILETYEILDEAGQPLPFDRLPGRRALLGERGAELVLRFRVRGSGEEHWSQVRAEPVYNNQGRVELAVSIFHDITALKQNEITQRLLADAGELLSHDLDSPALLGRVAELTVPALADYAILYQLDSELNLTTAGVAHADPAQLPMLKVLAEYRNPTPDRDSAVREALLRQEPVLLARLDGTDVLADMPPALRRMPSLVPHSMILVPLVARGRLNGLMALARSDRAQIFTPADLTVAQELARRAALALDNSELYAQSLQTNARLEEGVRARTEELNLALDQLRVANTELQTEITERQAAEERFRTLLQSAPDATVIVDRKGAVLIANRQAEQMFGWEAQELVGRPVERLLPKSLGARHRLHRRDFYKHPQTRSMGQGLELLGRHRDGHEFPVEVSLSPLETPDGLLVTASVRDISARRRAEAALRQSERQLAQAQQIARLGSWRWDLAADELTWSDVLAEIHGVTPPVRPMSYLEFLGHIHPDDQARVNAVIGAARRSGGAFEYEHRIRRADGAERSLYSRGEVLRDANGQPQMMTVITQDLTERKRIEQELFASREQLRQLSGHLQAAREAERARLSREVHDELGGTLTGLKMDMARLAKNADALTPAELRERARDMSQLIDATVQVVRRIASDLRPGILDDFGLAAAIEWQLKEFGARAGLDYEYGAPEVELALDPATSTALFRLFQETMTNVARHAQATRVSVQLQTTPEEVVLDIRDNGRGITADQIANAQSLGLLGMRERVHLLKGQLTIEGAPSQGTRVLIRVPLPPGEAAVPAAGNI